MTKKDNQKLKDLLFSTFNFLAANESNLFKEPEKGFLPHGYYLKRFVFNDILKNKKSLREFTKRQSGVYIWVGFSKETPQSLDDPFFRPYTYVGCSYVDLYKRITNYKKAYNNRRLVERFIEANGLSQLICLVFTIHKTYEPEELCIKTSSSERPLTEKIKGLIASHLEYHFIEKLKPNLNCRHSYSPSPPDLRG